MSYNDVYRLLIPAGFYIKDTPCFVGDNYFRSEWHYESDKLYCEITFLKAINDSSSDIENVKNIRGSFYSISIRDKTNMEPPLTMDNDSDSYKYDYEYDLKGGDRV